MRLNVFVHRSFAWAGLFVCSLMAGCIPFVPVYYAYPTVSHVPALTGVLPRDEVQAFRVDVIDQMNCVDFDDQDQYVLSPVSLSRNGKVPSQSSLAFDCGWIWNCIAHRS